MKKKFLVLVLLWPHLGFSTNQLVDWYCFDKNLGVEVIVYDRLLGDIEFNFMNEDLGQLLFRLTCKSFETHNDRLTSFRCRDNKYGEFGFGIVEKYNHSINMGYFYDNQGQFPLSRPIGSEKYNEFLVCSRNFSIVER